MTGDFEVDAAAAQAAARTIAELLEAQLASGVDPAVLGTATVGMGADLLAKALGKEKAVKALRLLADELPKIEVSDSRHTMN